MARHRPRGWRRRQHAARPRAADRAQRVHARVAQMAPEDIVEDLDAAFLVGVAQRQDLRHQIGMRANGALPEDDQIARQDVGALDRDGDGHGAVQGAQVIAGAVHDGAARVHVHGVVHRHAHALGGVVFHDARHHRRLDALIERGARQAARGFDQIGVAGQTGQPFLHALELADRDAELLAHPRIHAGGVRAHRRGGGRQRRQRNAAPGGQCAHQHLPALPGALDAADQRIQRHKNVAARVGPVLEHLHGGQVAPADLDAGRVGGNERHRDADILGPAQDAVGVRHLERQPQHRGHRPQRDVALVPIEPDADELPPIHDLAAHDAGIHHRGRVRAGFGTGQAKARDFPAVGKPWQPVIALRLRAELHEQFARPQRVRHHDGDTRRNGIGGNAPHHFGVRIGREPQAAVTARNDHAEEALRLEVFPDVRRQIAPVPGDIPFIQHAAQFAHGTVDEALFIRRQRGRRHAEQLAPVGIAREQVGVPPAVAGFDGFAFGGRHGRHGIAGPAVCGFRNAAPAPGVEIHGSPCCSLQDVSGQSTRIGAARPSCGLPTLRQWASPRRCAINRCPGTSAC